MDKVKRIAVIGVGNILMGDEGLGVRAVEKLEARKVPLNVTLFDGGTFLHSLLGTLEGFDKAVIIDAVKGGSAPGAIYRFTLQELESKQTGEPGRMLSLHELVVPKALALEKLVSKLPEEIIFLGMEPEKIIPSRELSETVSGKMDQLLDAVEKEFSETKGGRE